jgi:hypothetical protein
LEELTFLEERDEALFAAYKNALRQPDCKSHQQAISMAINSPTSQFWISPFRAYREILWRKRGKRPSRMSDGRSRLVDDLYKVYLRMKDQPMFRGCSTFFISQFAVGCTAPRGFYISMRSAVRIINRKRHEKGVM